MKNNPLISFCIATYKREIFLKNTLSSILNQDYTNIEIIVSDNDPKGSAEDVVKSFNSKKIIYNKNQKNMGMVKNFNKSFSFAKGDFVTFVADDDPIEKDMLKTLIPLYRKYSDADSFFGASSVYIENSRIAELYSFNVGINSLESKIKKHNEINVYTPDSFLKEFFNYNVLSYFLWSSGFVKRSLVKNINGMPDYGSPFLTDYTYICLVGSLGKMIIINKPLARQNLHEHNFGRTIENISTLPLAIDGYYKKLKTCIKRYNLQDSYETFITNWTVDHFVDTFIFSKKNETNIKQEDLINIYKKIEKDFPFFKKREFELRSKLYYPNISLPVWKFINRVRRKIKYLKNKY